MLTPDVRHHVEIEYFLDTVNKVMTVVSITLDGTTWDIGVSIPAMAVNWTEGVYPQIQLDLNALAGQFSIIIDNCEIVWW